MSEILTVEQAAVKLKVKPNTVRGWLKKGRIPGRKIGRVYRILESDLERFVHVGEDDKRLEAWKKLSLEEKKRRLNALAGKYADLKFSSEDLIRERQEEAEREEQKWRERFQS